MRSDLKGTKQEARFICFSTPSSKKWDRREEEKWKRGGLNKAFQIIIPPLSPRFYSLSWWKSTSTYQD